MQLNSSFLRFAVAALASSIAGPSLAVSLSDSGRGQALIYPYFSVQPSKGDTQNTYLSVVNETASAKALRVRFHSAVDGKDIGSLNVYLAAHDSWAAALVPRENGARVISSDRSCTTGGSIQSDGTMQLDLASAVPVGPDLRTEGWVEVLEMAVLQGTLADAVSLDEATEKPKNCNAVAGGQLSPLGAPSGGIAGTFTVINVANGLEFSGNAIALDRLAAFEFHRPSSDPYPSLNASEIAPVSIVESEGYIYRSEWSRPIDAVSAVFMRKTLSGEFVLDTATKSQTDVVLTFPTWEYYVSTPPFSSSCSQSPQAFQFEPMAIDYASRSGQIGRAGQFNGGGNSSYIPLHCYSVNVFDFQNGSPPVSRTRTGVLGSATNNFLPYGSVILSTGVQNGSFSITRSEDRPMVSLPSSTRINAQNGQVIVGSHRYDGLPFAGMTVRTFENGMLSCQGGVCQGNYGGLFPMKFSRSISLQ